MPRMTGVHKVLDKFLPPEHRDPTACKPCSALQYYMSAGRALLATWGLSLRHALLIGTPRRKWLLKPLNPDCGPFCGRYAAPEVLG